MCTFFFLQIVKPLLLPNLLVLNNKIYCLLFCLSLKGGNRTRKSCYSNLKKCVLTWKMYKNGNRTHDMIEKWESNPWIFSTGNRTHDYVDGVTWTYTIVRGGKSNQEPIQVWNLNPIQVFKRDLNPWISRLNRSNINVRIWESKPWIMFYETKYWSICCWLEYF